MREGGGQQLIVNAIAMRNHVGVAEQSLAVEFPSHCLSKQQLRVVQKRKARNLEEQLGARIPP